MERSNRRSSDAGFSLLEALVALTIAATGLTTLAQLFVLAARADIDARKTTLSTTLAAQKMEQLLLPSYPLEPDGSDALLGNTAGRYDFLDAYGRFLGAGVSEPPGTAFIRRWSVQPARSAPDGLLIQVLVQPRQARAVAESGTAGVLRQKPGSAHLVAIKAPEIG